MLPMCYSDGLSDGLGLAQYSVGSTAPLTHHIDVTTLCSHQQLCSLEWVQTDVMHKHSWLERYQAVRGQEIDG